MEKLRVVLASSSPRRLELLHNIVEDFVVIPSHCEEVENGKPETVALTNAIRKARACSEGDIIIACDTLVACGDKIYGKPHTKADAINILSELSGRWHSVFSGVCVVAKGREITFVEESKVKFYNLSREQIKNYVNEFLPLDKAGSYGIQDGVMVECYTGDFDNIVGLPSLKLKEVLGEFCHVK